MREASAAPFSFVLLGGSPECVCSGMYGVIACRELSAVRAWRAAHQASELAGHVSGVVIAAGVGHHRNKLQSFELALRAAGIEKCNLVTISSIFPPECKIVSRDAGVGLLQPGQITFVVLARESTDEPNRLVHASVGLARPDDQHQYGYISEHHGFGETQRKSGDFAEDLAATMLASTLGIELDPNKAWDERKKLYVAGRNRQFVSRSITQSAEGHRDGLWTTVVASAVMLLDD